MKTAVNIKKLIYDKYNELPRTRRRVDDMAHAAEVVCKELLDAAIMEFNDALKEGFLDGKTPSDLRSAWDSIVIRINEIRNEKIDKKYRHI